MKDAPLLTWKGRRVRSDQDTPESVVLKVPEAPIRPGVLFFVPSPLDGWGIDELLRRLPPESSVVLFEKDPELRNHCQSSLETFLGESRNDPRLFWLEADTEAAVRTLFTKLPLSRLRRCEFLPLNGAWLPHAPRYREIFSRLETGLVRWWSNRITSIHLGPLWIRNLVDNLASSSFRWQPWPDWGSTPILVCGAGVTLETALPWVREYRHQVRVLAVDTALSVLQDWQIVPDAIVCLEAQHANLRDFAGWTPASIPLFADLTSFPPVTREFSSSVRWFVTEFAELELWNRWPWDTTSVPRLPPLGSVGVAAAWISWQLGNGPVILAGLDFSFPGGKTHARGAPSLKTLLARTNRFQPVEQVSTWLGPGIRSGAREGWMTTPIMKGYADVLADQAQPHAPRTWVWNRDGLPLGLPPWESSAGFQTPSLPISLGQKPPNPNQEGMNPPVREWLISEMERWRTLQSVLRSPNPEKDWSDAEALMRQLDYLTFSFPDPEPRKDRDWTARALARVEWILERVQHRIQDTPEG